MLKCGRPGMIGSRFPADRIAERAAEAFPLDHRFVAVFQTESIAETGDASAQKVYVSIARKAMGVVFETVAFHVGQREDGVRFARDDLLRPKNRASALDRD